MLVPNRHESSESYRYGFNGKEKDDEIKGEGDSYDFGARMYDPRTGRWFAVDKMRMKAPDWSPYRFGFDNPMRYKDSDGNWEEDGHFWTVYAMGIAMGLNKATARSLAIHAEYYDHHVAGANNTMPLHLSHDNGEGFSRLFGIGTWADKSLQKSWHGLTGGKQSDVLKKAQENVLSGDLNQLHTVGDSWAHSYVDDNKNRTMWGKTNIWLPVLGRITLEHAFWGGNGNFHADDIADRPYEYKMYQYTLIQLFNNKKFKYNNQITNSKPDLAIFDLVQKNGGNKNSNIFLLESYIGLKTGVKSFSSTSKHNIDNLKIYLNQKGIKYTESSSAEQVSGGSSTVGTPIYTTITTYKIKIKK
ncbi:RHS repeat-associated core domain-containing protein [Flavobacterium sp. WV_118_3]|uniref:RHS repeat domain-containing protein n=1 Tax=Flavobacterium sp. WV_118_3 TaxID=3151764 RepID=UPI00321ACDCC